MNETEKIMFLIFCPHIAPMLLLLINIPIIFPVFFSTWIVSKYIYEPMLNDAVDEDREWREYLYFEELNKDYSKKFPLLKDLSENNPPEYNLLCDTTPNGFVLFRYI